MKPKAACTPAQGWFVPLQDDFDLQKIATSGQCFRATPLEDGAWRFLHRGHVLRLQVREGGLLAQCTPEDWDAIWRDYFDLERSYADLRRRAAGKDPFLQRAMDFGAGLRVLRQDPWEMLVTFILSQRKNIPAIARCVETLAARYGEPLEQPAEVLYAFPDAEAMRDASETDLHACGLGYRAPYVMDAIARVCDGRLDLSALRELEDTALLSALQETHGVGIKVASCVALFGYGRTACVPIDVWVERVIRERCGGRSPFEAFGQEAGILQQYAFYYQIHQPKP